MYLSFIIPVRNDAARLAKCLAAVGRSAAPKFQFEIVVADNGSTDGTRDVAAEAHARVLCFPNKRVSEMRNDAARAARGDVLAFIDADHEVSPGWAAGATDALSGDRVGAVGAIYLPPPQGTWVQWIYGALRGRTIGRSDTAWLGSGNLAVRRAAFEAVGGFDASLETCEDVDLCQRLREMGWRVLADERLQSIHDGNPRTLGALFRSERWRGRDNLRVSLRGSLSLRDVPSMLIPLIDLMAAAAFLWGLITAPVAGWPSIVTCAVAVGTVVALSTLRVLRAMSRGLVGARAFLSALVVAVTWDAARAVALVYPAPHHRAKREDAPSQASAP